MSMAMLLPVLLGAVSPNTKRRSCLMLMSLAIAACSMLALPGRAAAQGTEPAAEKVAGAMMAVTEVVADTGHAHKPGGEANLVLPSLRGNPLAPPERAAVPAVKATCSGCSTEFHAVRSLTAATVLQCPSCGRKETLPPPVETASAKAPRRGTRPKRR